MHTHTHTHMHMHMHVRGIPATARRPRACWRELPARPLRAGRSARRTRAVSAATSTWARGASARSSHRPVGTPRPEHLALNTSPWTRLGKARRGVGWRPRAAGCVAAPPRPTKPLSRSHMRAPHHAHHAHHPHSCIARRRTATQARPQRARRHRVRLGRRRERHGRPGCGRSRGVLGKLQGPSGRPRAGGPSEPASVPQGAAHWMRDAGATQTGAEGPEVTGQGGTGEGWKRDVTCISSIAISFRVLRRVSRDERLTK